MAWMKDSPPFEIQEKHLPLLVLTDNVRSIFGLGIKIHTDGFYSHVMWCHKIVDGEAIVASQGWTFKELPLSKFTNRNYLKLWRRENWIGIHRELVRLIVEDMLRRPWWKRRYDWLGILGHAINFPPLNFPFRQYCSESAGRILRRVDNGFTKKHPTPADLNRFCSSTEGYEVVNRWIPTF